MLELCFDRSTQGALKCAQRCDRDMGGAFAVTLAGEDGKRPSQLERRRALREVRRQAEERRRRAVPLGGSPADVLVLSLGLDQGDIQSPLAEACPRRDLLCRWYGQHGDALERDWRETLAALARLRTLGPGDTVRIWVDGQPHAACGLLMAAELLRDTAAEVLAVPLPFWRQTDESTAVQYSGWGEVHPEEFGQFLHLERPLPPLLLRLLSDRWRALKAENAPLRAVVNGEVRSVPEEFYDHFLRKHLPLGEEKRVALVIGDVLGRERPGVGDGLLAERLREMLRRGEAEIVQAVSDREDGERNFYRSTIRRVK